MIAAISPITPSANAPVQGFQEISPLGCAFAVMVEAFSESYLAMQKAGIAEAQISAEYNENGIELTDQKEVAIQELRTAENKVEWEIANAPDPSKTYPQHHELQELQAEEGQVKTTIDAMVTQDQANGSNASQRFSGALKGMNATFDCAKDGINKVVGAAMQLGNLIANN